MDNKIFIDLGIARSTLVPLSDELERTEEALNELDEQNCDFELNWISDSMNTYMYIDRYMHRLVKRGIRQIEESIEVISDTSEERQDIDYSGADVLNGG